MKNGEWGRNRFRKLRKFRRFREFRGLRGGGSNLECII